MGSVSGFRNLISRYSPPPLFVSPLRKDASSENTQLLFRQQNFVPFSAPSALSHVHIITFVLRTPDSRACPQLRLLLLVFVLQNSSLQPEAFATASLVSCAALQARAKDTRLVDRHPQLDAGSGGREEGGGTAGFRMHDR